MSSLDPVARPSRRADCVQPAWPGLCFSRLRLFCCSSKQRHLRYGSPSGGQGPQAHGYPPPLAPGRRVRLLSLARTLVHDFIS